MPQINVIPNVFKSGFQLEELEWKTWSEPGRVGVDRHELWTPSENEESVGLLVRYPPGAHGDFHEHLGYELMLVLDGVIDHSNGQSFSTGALIVEEPGTLHRMSTEEGATILAIRTKPTDPKPEQAPALPSRELAQ